MARQQSNEIRKELKFKIPNYLEKEILTRLNASGWIKHYPNRIIHTLYFDNEFDSMLFDSINGLADRKKIRLRWYNDYENFHLEVKKKKGDVSFKKNIDTGNMELLLKKDKILVNRNIQKIFNLNSLELKSSVDYKRIYLYNKYNQTRITFDKDISTLDFVSQKNRSLKDFFILELKCNLDFNYNFDILNSQSRFSKYSFSRLGDDI
jgi:hypothetical protein